MPIHNLSGFLPSFSVVGVVIPVYYLVIAISFIVSMMWLVSRADARGLSRNRALDISLVLMISGFIGARLFHVLYEEPAYYWARPILVFDIWSGGFVWYGGAITSAAACFLFLRLKNEEAGPWLDLFAPVCALGYAIGRVACVLTGCCYGRVFELGHELYRHPTQSYAVAWELMALALLVNLEKLQLRKRVALFARSGQLFLFWLVLHALGRIFMESFRDDPRGSALLGVSISTWLSLGILVASVTALYLRGRSRITV